MQHDFYSEYSEIEDRHWWFRGRREIFARLLARVPVGVSLVRLAEGRA